MRIGVEIYNAALSMFDYNPDSGDVTYKFGFGNRHSIGDNAGWYNNRGYLLFDINGNKLLCHRFGYYCMKGELPNSVDHINGIRDDNGWCNLRSCTHAENSMNRGMNSRNKSGYRGVYKDKRRATWNSEVAIKGIKHTKSGFKTPELANEWVVNKSKELYGSFYNEERT